MIRLLEELSINALPSIDTIFYDGWILRFSYGYSKRANSINPLYPSKYDLDIKIKYCEELYHSKKLPIIFKLTSIAYPENLDYILENKGYAYIEPTSVYVLNLNYSTAPNNKNIIIYNNVSDQWIRDYCIINNIKYEHMDKLKLMLKNIVSKKYFISLMDNDQLVACGLGIIENDYIGLYNISVNANLRGKGYGQQLLLNLLHIGVKNGAQNAYLQVSIKNIPALHLYRKFGFKEKYKYWYRAKV